jgi:hypothetical protein
MLAIRSKFCQIVFPQPRRMLNGLETKIGFNFPPQASPLISLMYQLEEGASKHMESSPRIATVNQQARAALGQPFVIKRRDGFEPAAALIESFPP